MTKFVATGRTAEVETFPRDGRMERGDVAAFVTTLPALSHHASVAEPVVNRSDDVTAAHSLRRNSP